MNTKQTGHGDKKENKSVHFCVAFIRPSLAVPISNDFYKMRRRLTSQPKCTNFREKKTYCSLRQWVFISGSFLLFFFLPLRIILRRGVPRSDWRMHEHSMKYHVECFVGPRYLYSVKKNVYSPVFFSCLLFFYSFVVTMISDDTCSSVA